MDGFNKFKSVSLGLLLATSIHAFAASKQRQIAIVGDSGATGAVADPTLDTSLPDLLGHALTFLGESQMTDRIPAFKTYPNPSEFGLTNPIEPLTRIFYSKKELQQNDIVQLNLAEKVDQQIDIEEYSWGYLIGRKMGIEPRNILMAAQDGKRIETIEPQFERLLEVDPQFLPPQIFVSYTANDFCHESNLTADIQVIESRYRQSLIEQFETIRQRFHPHPGDGTRIYVLAPLPAINILTSPSVLAKIVFFYQGPVTCGDLREGRIHRELFGFDAGQILKGECPAILGTHPSYTARVQKLKEIYEAVLRAQRTALGELTRHSADGFQFIYIPETADIQMAGEDVGNDCFHPSLNGHIKIARTVLQALAQERSQ